MTITVLKNNQFTASVCFFNRHGKYKAVLKVYMKNRKGKKYLKWLPYKYDELTKNIKNEEWIKNITEGEILELIDSKQPKVNHNSLYLSTLVYNCKLRAKRDGLDFLLKKEDVQFLYNKNPNCALSNIPLSLQKGYMSSISIDRIDNSIGYVKNNIQLVCKSINFMKNSHSDDECKSFIYKIKNN